MRYVHLAQRRQGQGTELRMNDCLGILLLLNVLLFDFLLKSVEHEFFIQGLDFPFPQGIVNIITRVDVRQGAIEELYVFSLEVRPVRDVLFGFPESILYFNIYCLLVDELISVLMQGSVNILIL